MLRVVLNLVLVTSTIGTLFLVGMGGVGLTEWLNARGREPAKTVLGLLSFVMSVAAFFAIGPVASMVLNPGGNLPERMLLLLCVTPMLFPITNAILILAEGWEPLTGTAVAHGGHPPSRLSELGRLALMEGLFLLPPATAWILLSLD